MFSTIPLKFSILVAGGLVASVRSISLSSDCKATLAGVMLNKDAQCLNTGSLITYVANGVPTNSSLIEPINIWLTGACGQAACSNATLAAVVGNITAGCPDELQSITQALGVDSSVSTDEITTTITNYVQTYYPTVRSIACLQDSSNGSAFCVTETLYNLEAITGTFDVANIEQVVEEVRAGSISSISSNITCTNCTKAAYNLVNQNFPDLLLGEPLNTDVIEGQCGASFVDGTSTPEITESADNSTANVNTFANDASPLSYPQMGMTVSLLAIVSSLASFMA